MYLEDVNLQTIFVCGRERTIMENYLSAAVFDIGFKSIFIGVATLTVQGRHLTSSFTSWPFDSTQAISYLLLLQRVFR